MENETQTPAPNQQVMVAEVPATEAHRMPKPQLEAGAKVAPIIPRTIDEVARVAQAVIVAGLAPNSYEGGTEKERASKIIIGIMKGAEVGFPPITALSTIAIINGRPCIWGDGAVALIQASGMVEKVMQMYEGQETPDGLPDDFTAVYSIHRKGQENPYVGRFSVKDAKRARLWGNPKRAPWMDYPKRMLMMRARAFALRDGFADRLMGLSIAEEAQDIAPAVETVSTSFLDDNDNAGAAQALEASGSAPSPQDASAMEAPGAPPKAA